MKSNKIHTTRDNPAKVLQFGGGNFLRAFIDDFIEVLNEKTSFNGNIIIVKPTKSGDYAALKNQNGHYNIILEGIKDEKASSITRTINCISNIIHSYNEYDAYIATAKIPSIRFIISNTTEAGITFNNNDLLEDTPAKEFPAKLTQWLFTRYNHFNGEKDKGCIFLPCELIESNGTSLQKAIIDYINLWELPNDFKEWILKSNYFCNTLVDRIVSGYSEKLSEKIYKEKGYKDELLVVGETYHSWLIEGPDFIAKELPFSQTDLQVKFVNDLTPYRKLKVRVLNGAHTAMVPVAYLAGIKTVKDVMKQQELLNFVQNFLQLEVMPIMSKEFSENEIENFINDTLNRFKNPYLEHQLIRISLNSITKFRTRLLPTLIDFYEQKNSPPKHIIFSLAALIVFYKGKYQETEIPLKDDEKYLKFFKRQWDDLNKERISINQFTHIIAKSELLFENDLTQFPELTILLEQYINSILSMGVLNSLSAINLEN
ncbi:tagaturonate reductase [Joostella atrarenae]|uniref:Tagaturonate reductase n=1 Tax=Joostella atrarenae TaxID=679257 RepID=A0ABS9J725_9FLAO|nr:tagaturonate reductase [Joostella atrarenae]MCF8716230.1 tagaturonate reductase [Joostella atrarenae]